MNGEAVAFAAKVAAEVGRIHEGDPEAELVVWLEMALRREASVGELYGGASVERRLAAIRGPARLVTLVRSAVVGVWAQERAHAAYLEAVLGAVNRRPHAWPRAVARFAALRGAVEGLILSARTSESGIERLASSLVLAVGRHVEEIPGFVDRLSALTFAEFCRFNADLEITAVHGYERLLVLLGQLGDDVTPLGVDVERMIRDERFHHALFVAIAGWFAAAPGDRLRPGLSRQACAAELGAIRDRIYQGA